MSLVITGTLSLATIGLLASLLLASAKKKYAPAGDSVIDAINRALPQTQCAQCGYPGCRPYAEAIATGERINRCPPGGEATIHALAELLGRPVEPLDPECGETKPPIKAVIREDECIGCTLCIQACPVDAIMGTSQAMHTVIENEWTGCELCVPPCPVDCIDLVDMPVPPKMSMPLLTHDECIRCGLCEPVCPRDLSPEALYWYRDGSDQLDTLRLDACIECRRCDRACPSNIPLTDYFRQSKANLREKSEADVKARNVEMRYERHVARLDSRKVKVRPRPSSREKSALLEEIKGKESGS
jgi:electron transport complex protein RnfB